jgi:hypothetical protein
MYIIDIGDNRLLQWYLITSLTGYPEPINFCDFVFSEVCDF